MVVDFTLLIVWKMSFFFASLLIIVLIAQTPPSLRISLKLVIKLWSKKWAGGETPYSLAVS